MHTLSYRISQTSPKRLSNVHIDNMVDFWKKRDENNKRNLEKAEADWEMPVKPVYGEDHFSLRLASRVLVMSWLNGCPSLRAASAARY